LIGSSGVRAILPSPGPSTSDSLFSYLVHLVVDSGDSWYTRALKRGDWEPEYPGPKEKKRMNISKLALIALLGSALMAFGCGDDDNGAGGDGGTGGTAGTGGAGGDGGTGGVGGDGGTGGTGGAVVPVACDDSIAASATYTFTCTLSGLPIPLPVGITINVCEPGPELVANVESDLTTQLGYSVAPAVIGLLPDLAPDAEITAVDVTVGVAGGMPLTITHTADGLPFSPAPEFISDLVTTAVTPDLEATEIALSVEAFTTVVEGLPTSLVPEGFIELSAGIGDCDALATDDGPVTLPVSGPPM